MRAWRLFATALCILIDVVILGSVAAAFAILITGGGFYEVAGVRIRARHVDNPLAAAAVLMFIRCLFLPSGPVLGRARWPLTRLLAGGARWVSELTPPRLAGLFARPRVALAIVAMVTIGLKLWLAWSNPGFFSGDDVEIHEMTFAALFGYDWRAWELRNAFFPMTFIYPAQRVAAALGATSPDALVFTGRVAVALASTATIPLVWVAARRIDSTDMRFAASAVLLLATNKLFIAFGSTELPRPVATVFAAGAFVMVLRPHAAAGFTAGVLLGIAAAFRFSEAVFIAPALITLGCEGFVKRAGSLLLGASATFAVIVGASDAWYWGSPFSSLVAAMEYTVLQGESSRGYEPVWHYLARVHSWTTLPVFILAILGSSRRDPESWWLWLPIIVLSLLPHKENRYLIPIVPFLALAAARGLLRTIDWMRATAAASDWRRSVRHLALPVLLLGLLHDAGGWRLARSNEGVSLARYLRGDERAGLAVQDSWRLGGRPFLWTHEPLIELPADSLEDNRRMAALLADVRYVALRMRAARTIGDAAVAPFGFDRGWTGEDYVLYVQRPPRPPRPALDGRPKGLRYRFLRLK